MYIPTAQPNIEHKAQCPQKNNHAKNREYNLHPFENLGKRI